MAEIQGQPSDITLGFQASGIVSCQEEKKTKGALNIWIYSGMLTCTQTHKL